MTVPHEGASSSRITLRSLAESLRDDSDCICDDGQDEDDGTPYCACAGDDCWHCAALMAIANADETAAALGEPCVGCGKRSRITTAGCDHCEYEDK